MIDQCYSMRFIALLLILHAASFAYVQQPVATPAPAAGRGGRGAPALVSPEVDALAEVELVGADDLPIGVYMNYAMQPINFYLSGVISADFRGEASKYIEELFDNKTVAVFSQGASGDQNPRLGYSQSFNMVRAQSLGPPQTVAPPQPRHEDRAAQGFNAAAAGSSRQAIPPEKMEPYKKAIARTGEYVVMLGQMIATTAVRVMREEIKSVDTTLIWAGQERFSCPGRERLDAANRPARNVFPGYKDGAEVNFKLGLLRIGHQFRNGERSNPYAGGRPSQ